MSAIRVIDSHLELNDIGINTHVQIDSHIADMNIHFAGLLSNIEIDVDKNWNAKSINNLNILQFADVDSQLIVYDPTADVFGLPREIPYAHFDPITSFNTFFGGFCGAGCTGIQNTAFGAAAITNATGEGNSVLGFAAGLNLTSGNQNLLIGAAAGYELTEGCDNMLLGTGAGHEFNTHSRNTMVGTETGYHAYVDDSVFIGYQAGYLATGGGNTFIGWSAGYDTFGPYLGGGSSKGVFIGYTAGYGLAEGTQNICIGYEVAFSPSGNLIDNVLIGYQAGMSAREAVDSVFIGTQAGKGTAGINNIGIGTLSGSNSEGSGNTLIGYKAGKNIGKLDYNTGIGFESLVGDGGNAEGNIAIGARTLVNIIHGSYNIALGHESGMGYYNNHHSIFIGSFTGKNLLEDYAFQLGNQEASSRIDNLMQGYLGSGLKWLKIGGVVESNVKYEENVDLDDRITTNLTNGKGMLIVAIEEGGNIHTGLFRVDGESVGAIVSAGAEFSIVLGNAGTVNVFFDSGNLEVENKWLDAIDIRVGFFGVHNEDY